MLKIFKIPAIGEPYECEIDNTLEAMQEVVGGHIEVVPITDRHCLIVNEEGKLGAYLLNVFASNLFRACTKNDDLIFGDAFVTYYDGGEDFTDLTEEGIEELKNYIWEA